MKMRRKLIFQKIILIFLVFTIVSCQIVPNEATGTPSAVPLEEQKTPILPEEGSDFDTESGVQELEKIDGNIEIEFWHPWAGEMAELIDELVTQYNSENLWSNKIISRSHADQDVLIEDLTDSFENGEKIPDLIVSSSQSLQTWYSDGYSIRELDAILQLLVEENGGEGLPQIFPVFWNVDLVDGERIGIPAYQSGQFLFYNQTWGEELGFLDHPQNTEEFSDQTCLAERTNRFDKDIENNGTGGWIYSRESLSLLAWLRVFDGGVLINSRSQPILAESENVEALRFLYGLYLDDCAWIGKQQQPYTYFSKRFALLFSGQMEDMIRQLRIDETTGNSDKWKLIPYPSSIDKPVVMVKGLSFAIASEDDVRAIAALDFVRWMLQPEKQAEIIEKTGVFPLSNETIELVNNDSSLYSIWRDSLQYLPYAQPEPVFEEWYAMEKVLEDVGWQLIQFTIQPEKIESILSDAEIILREIKEPGE